MVYSLNMQDPQLIWRLGRRVTRRVDGVARLIWAGGTLTLHLRDGRAVAATGPDPGEVARRLDLGPTGRTDLLAEARALAAAHGIAEAQAVGTAKEVIQAALAGWIDDPDRDLEFTEQAIAAGDGPNVSPSISMTHAMVELVLASSDRDLAIRILPDAGVLLRRVPSFLELYAPLRLSEEADLVVAKISGQRTAEEITGRSPHGVAEVRRLLAALVAAGLLEAVPVATPAADVTLIPPAAVGLESDQPPRRRLTAFWIGAGLVVAAAILGYVGLRLVAPTPTPPLVVAPGQPVWGLVVDMGCEAGDIQRLLKKAKAHAEEVQPVAAADPTHDPCWRLTWGRFPNQAAALAQVERIPRGLRRDGFAPHAIQLPAAAAGLDALERGAK